MGYLFLMTSAGSALYIGYLLWARIFRESTTQCMKYRALMIVMFAYVVPWAWLGGTYRRIMSVFMLDEVNAGANGVVDVANIETKGAAYQTKEYRLLLLMTLIWFMIAMLFLLIRTIKFLKRSHSFHGLAIKCEDKNLEQTLKGLRETIRFKHMPEIAWTRVDNKTFTLGAVKPIIYLQKKYVEGDLYWILKHEMVHIIGRDIWVKLLMEFVCCLHWFNPLIYFLESEIKYLSETSCNERVLKGCTDMECQAYIDLLDRNRSGGKQKIPFSSALEGGNEIDRRIALMRQRKKIGHREKAMAIGVFAFLVFLNSLTALAYPKIYHVKETMIEVAKDSMDGGNFWIYDYAKDGYGTYTDAVLYNEQFVDKDGHIHQVASKKEQEACTKHEIVPGVVQIHKKDSQGCTLETYDGTRCSECGNMWKGDLLYITNKMPCPH